MLPNRTKQEREERERESRNVVFCLSSNFDDRSDHPQSRRKMLTSLLLFSSCLLNFLTRVTMATRFTEAPEYLSLVEAAGRFHSLESHHLRNLCGQAERVEMLQATKDSQGERKVSDGALRRALRAPGRDCGRLFGVFGENAARFMVFECAAFMRVDFTLQYAAQANNTLLTSIFFLVRLFSTTAGSRLTPRRWTCCSTWRPRWNSPRRSRAFKGGRL